jgi:Protein of unknown function (DUF3551)
MEKSLLTLLVFGALTAVTAPIHSAAAAIEYPWCSQYAGGPTGGGRNCGFATYAQCMQNIHGMGGFCEPNLFYLDRAEPVAKKRHHRGD